MGLLRDAFGSVGSFYEPKERLTGPLLNSQLAKIDAEIVAMYHKGIVSNDDAIKKVQDEGLDYYNTMLRTDAHLASVANKLLQSAAAIPFRVMPGDESPRAQEIADFINEVLFSFDVTEALEQMYHAKLKGFSVSEIFYRPMKWKGQKKIGIEKIQRVKESQFNVAVGRKILLKKLNDPDGKEINKKKFVVMFSGPGPWGDGMLNYAYPAYWFKKQSLVFFHGYQHRWANPSIIGIGPDPDAISDFLAELYEGEGGGSYAGVPEGTEFEIIQPAGSYDHVPGLNYMDDQISRLFTGGDLSVGHAGGRGNKAAAVVHAEGFDTLVFRLAQSGVFALNNQVIKPLVDQNFEMPDAYPYVILGDEEQEKPNEYIDRISKVASTGMIIEISKEEFYEKSNFSKPKNADGSDTLIIQGGGLGSPFSLGESSQSPPILTSHSKNYRSGSLRKVQKRSTQLESFIQRTQRS